MNIRFSSLWPYRVALAWVSLAFAAAGTLKILNPAEFTDAIMNFRLVPPVVAGALAVYLPWFELTLAAGLWWRYTSRPAWILSVCLLVGFSVVLTVTAARGIDVRCGCFGSGAGKGPSLEWALLRNLGLIGLLIFGRKATRDVLAV